MRSGERVLRVALIGAGKMGVNHLRAMSGCSGMTLVGVADPEVRADDLRPLVSPDTLFTPSLDELWGTRPDVVHIVTPPHTHAALAHEAIVHGAHVYVEKPFTLTRQDAESVMAAARQHGVTVSAGHQCLFDHAATIARPRLHLLGSIVHVESYFAFRTVRRSIRPIDQAKDILPHAVYMLIDFLRAGRDDTHDAPIELRGLDVDAEGGVYGIVALGSRRGLVTVTLTGRPVDQYVHVVGTNGSMRVDLVSGAVTTLAGPGASAIAAITNPYRQTLQLANGATRGFARRVRERKFGYPGLRPLFQAFYESVCDGTPPPVSDASIIETVALCEEIGHALDRAEARAEDTARARLDAAARSTSARSESVVLVTGAAGFLGRAVVRNLTARGWRVRALTRQALRFAAREPGVEYEVCDLARGVDPALMQDVAVVVHCAAETKGGKADQERNSIRATRLLLEAAAHAGISRLVHVSSVAVMKPLRGGAAQDESTPVDVDNSSRGPYVWGKAESERIVQAEGPSLGIQPRIVRLGPLVDYRSFDAPGRLGRELGSLYVAVGPKASRLALCDVETAARVIGSYVDDYDASPAVLNLVEPDAPTRRELVARLREKRPDLRVVWLPMGLLRVMSPPLKLAQRVLLRSSQPLDIASAFANLRYRTDLAEQVIRRAQVPSRTAPEPQPVDR
jgi:nucleoside-diphosphate-sugar epimerase/predicted dehydrogenase